MTLFYLFGNAPWITVWITLTNTLCYICLTLYNSPSALVEYKRERNMLKCQCPKAELWWLRSCLGMSSVVFQQAVTVGFGKEEKAKTSLIFPLLKLPLLGRTSRCVGKPLGPVLPAIYFHCVWCGFPSDSLRPVHLSHYIKINWHYM